MSSHADGSENKISSQIYIVNVFINKITCINCAMDQYSDVLLLDYESICEYNDISCYLDL